MHCGVWILQGSRISPAIPTEALSASLNVRCAAGMAYSSTCRSDMGGRWTRYAHPNLCQLAVAPITVNCSTYILSPHTIVGLAHV